MRVSDLVRMENGKVVERWGVEDMSGLSGQA
jgi:predicted ester cyclase